MKKALVLVFAMLISMGAMAQLNVTSAHDNTVKKIGQELRYNTADSTYFLSLPTSNQFDNNMTFMLGKGKKSAIQTLKDLADFLASSGKGDIIKVDNGYGEEYTIGKYDKQNLMMITKSHAGHRFIWKGKIERWQWLIDSDE